MLNMKTLVAVFSAAVLFVVSATAEEVVTLTVDNFQSTIDSNEYVLVEFYAPWCGHCKSLAPEYEKAAAGLKEYEPKVVIAKVDATEEESLAEEFGVQGFPTLKWFVNGKASDYGGGRVEKEIMTWVKKKTGPPAETLDDAAALDKFKADNEVAIVGLFKDEDQAKTFLDVARTDESATYAIAIENAAVNTAVGQEAGSIIAFRQFEEPEEPEVVFEGDISSEEEIAKFVAGNSLPLVVAFSQENAPKIFGGEIKSHVLVFIDSSDKEGKASVMKEIYEVAQKYKGEVLFVTVEKDDERILEFFGVKEEDLPTARIVSMAEEGMKKYKYNEENINAEGLVKVIEAYLKGELTQDLKSEEPIPESEQGDVYVLTGKDFDDVVNKPGVGVLVEFYAPWCGHCKKLEPEYDALGEKYKDNDKVIIAKMDATANEVDSVQVQGFPTLKWFPADSEDVVDFEGDRTTEGMAAFIDEQLA